MVRNKLNEVPLQKQTNKQVPKRDFANIKIDKTIVCIIGLGYVGLPLAEAFSKNMRVIGLDTNSNKIRKLDIFNHNQKLRFTTNVKEINNAKFIIICVPTPVTKSKEPDLSFVREASKTTGQNMKNGSIVILESTVYPGVTEEIVKPILEAESGLKCGKDFKIAYAPERVNPGDNKHVTEKIAKIVSGMDEETTNVVAELYYKVTPHVFKVKDIKTAEAAKVIENIQRDLNIALMNELSLIFNRLNLDTADVLEAASTKWNFHRYSPGLVGGHCIPVDPYYMVYRAQEFGYHCQVILAGRAINDSMAKHVAEMTIKAINDMGKVIKNSKVLIMGLTYKENVPDTRETPVKEVIKELREYGIDCYGYDPILDITEAKEEFGIELLTSLKDVPIFDATILAVAHDVFRERDNGISLDKLRKLMNDSPVLIDVRRCIDAAKARKKGFNYRAL